MKIKKIATLISTGTIVLLLAGCGTTSSSSNLDSSTPKQLSTISIVSGNTMAFDVCDYPISATSRSVTTRNWMGYVTTNTNVDSGAMTFRDARWGESGIINKFSSDGIKMFDISSQTWVEGIKLPLIEGATFVAKDGGGSSGISRNVVVSFETITTNAGTFSDVAKLTYSTLSGHYVTAIIWMNSSFILKSLLYDGTTSMNLIYTSILKSKNF